MRSSTSPYLEQPCHLFCGYKNTRRDARPRQTTGVLDLLDPTAFIETRPLYSNHVSASPMKACQRTSCRDKANYFIPSIPHFPPRAKKRKTPIARHDCAALEAQPCAARAIIRKKQRTLQELHPLARSFCSLLTAYCSLLTPYNNSAQIHVFENRSFYWC